MSGFFNRKLVYNHEYNTTTLVRIENLCEKKLLKGTFESKWIEQVLFRFTLRWLNLTQQITKFLDTSSPSAARDKNVFPSICWRADDKSGKIGRDPKDLKIPGS